MNYTPWAIRCHTSLLSLTFFILDTLAMSHLRCLRLTAEKRSALSFRIALLWRGGLGNLDKALSIVLVLSLLGAIGALGYMIATPGAGEQFTEFYVLGREGKAEDYPSDLVVGEGAVVRLGIVNHEGQEMSYRIEVAIDGVKSRELSPPVLADEEEWVEEVSFVPHQDGDNQRVEFLLYKSGESVPCETLLLFIDVRERF